MSKLEKVLLTLTAMETAGDSEAGMVPDARALLIVTVAYLIALLSVPTASISMLIWFGIYPVIGATIVCGGYGSVFRRSLPVLPLVLVIGIFNPILDHTPALSVAGVTVSRGWVSFISLTLRGLFAVQALLIMITVKGFNGLCDALRWTGIPGLFITQLQMVYRYLTELLKEALDMLRARTARAYGKKVLPVKDWGTFTGQLFLRTVRRSRMVHSAMLARGFSRVLPRYGGYDAKWRISDTVFCVVWIALFAALRFINFSALFSL